MSVKLSAVKRTEAGKGASRRARRSGQIPGVVYGKGMETIEVLLPAHETFMAVKDNRNSEIELDIEGDTYVVKFQEVQLHRVRRDILHVDLILASSK